MKKIIDMYCSERSRISKTELVDIAMRFFVAHGDEIVKEAVGKFIFGDSIEDYVRGKGLLIGINKKGEHKRAG